MSICNCYWRSIFDMKKKTILSLIIVFLLMVTTVAGSITLIQQRINMQKETVFVLKREIKENTVVHPTDTFINSYFELRRVDKGALVSGQTYIQNTKDLKEVLTSKITQTNYERVFRIGRVPGDVFYKEYLMDRLKTGGLPDGDDEPFIPPNNDEQLKTIVNPIKVIMGGNNIKIENTDNMQRGELVSLVGSVKIEGVTNFLVIAPVARVETFEGDEKAVNKLVLEIDERYEQFINYFKAENAPIEVMTYNKRYHYQPMVNTSQIQKNILKNDGSNPRETTFIPMSDDLKAVNNFIKGRAFYSSTTKTPYIFEPYKSFDNQGNERFAERKEILFQWKGRTHSVEMSHISFSGTVYPHLNGIVGLGEGISYDSRTDVFTLAENLSIPGYYNIRIYQEDGVLATSEEMYFIVEDVENIEKNRWTSDSNYQVKMGSGETKEFGLKKGYSDLLNIPEFTYTSNDLKLLYGDEFKTSLYTSEIDEFEEGLTDDNLIFDMPTIRFGTVDNGDSETFKNLTSMLYDRYDRFGFTTPYVTAQGNANYVLELVVSEDELLRLGYDFDEMTDEEITNTFQGGNNFMMYGSFTQFDPVNHTEVARIGDSKEVLVTFSIPLVQNGTPLFKEGEYSFYIFFKKLISGGYTEYMLHSNAEANNVSKYKNGDNWVSDENNPVKVIGDEGGFYRIKLTRITVEGDAMTRRVENSREVYVTNPLTGEGNWFETTKRASTIDQKRFEASSFIYVGYSDEESRAKPEFIDDVVLNKLRFLSVEDMQKLINVLDVANEKEGDANKALYDILMSSLLNVKFRKGVTQERIVINGGNIYIVDVSGNSSSPNAKLLGTLKANPTNETEFNDRTLAEYILSHYEAEVIEYASFFKESGSISESIKTFGGLGKYYNTKHHVMQASNRLNAQNIKIAIFIKQVHPETQEVRWVQFYGNSADIKGGTN